MFKHSWRYPQENQKNCSRCGAWKVKTSSYNVNKGRQTIKWKKLKI